MFPPWVTFPASALQALSQWMNPSAPLREHLGVQQDPLRRGTPLLSLVMSPKPWTSPLGSWKGVLLVFPLLFPFHVLTHEPLALDSTELPAAGIRTFWTQWHPGRAMGSWVRSHPLETPVPCCAEFPAGSAPSSSRGHQCLPSHVAHS